MSEYIPNRKIMKCPDCGQEMELIDTTYSNILTLRAAVGQHTGDIYWCNTCEEHYIDDFLSNSVHYWRY